MKNIFIISILFLSFSAKAQYYYKDILGTRETNQLLQTYKANKIISVTINSTEAGGEVADNFSVQQYLDLNAGILKTISKSGSTEQSVLTTFFDNKGQVVKTIDSAGTMISTTIYNYNGDGLLQSIKSTATDTLKSINEIEEHEWFYTANGQPQKMLRKINNATATEIKFLLDEKGNVTEEQTFKNGTTTGTLYYYYNDENHLTDIVRYNNKAKKLLPDYMFEYSDDGKVIQKITVPGNSSDYQIWRYQFDDRGLKIREALFDRDKQLIGKIQYSYLAAQ
jgi:antitoxin component YwqK of YwqJK toxin-antitoxin module